MAEWKKGIDINLIIHNLEETRKYRDGKVTFESGFLGLPISTQLLFSFLEIDKEIPDQIVKGIIFTAIFNVGQEVITNTKLINEITSLEKSYLNSPKRKYYVITTLSIHKDCQIPPMRIKDVTFTFKNKLRKGICEARNQHLKQVLRLLISTLPEDYIYVQGCTSARSPEEAFEKTFECLTLLRFFWNFYYLRDQGFTMMLSANKQKPLNKIIVGPFHSVHFENGKPAMNTFMYNPSFLWAIPPMVINSNLNEILELQKKYRRKISKHKYQNEILIGVSRYVNALDEFQTTNAFIKLWGVLEYWTNSWQKEHSIQRTCSLFNESSYEEQILKHLKEYRNRITHSDHNNQDEINFLYQLLYFVNFITLFHLWNNFGFSSLAETSDFLALPSDNVGILKKLNLYKKAKRYRRI